MAGRSNGDGGTLLTEINVTPLVDVVLVLLVIMMVTATALADKTIAVELPKAQAGDTTDAPRPLVIAIDESGAFWLETTRADETTVRAKAREALARDARASAVLAADGRARHESVVRALDVLRSEHMAKIAIVVRADPAR
jgi:biopolymer transport protein ExbD